MILDYCLGFLLVCCGVFILTVAYLFATSEDEYDDDQNSACM